MDDDIVEATLGVLGLACLASVWGDRVGNHLKPGFRLSLFAAVLLVATVHASAVVGRLEITKVVSGSSVIFTTNITPVLILFAIGLAWNFQGFQKRTQHLRFVGMAALSIAFFLAPQLRPWLRPVVSDEQTRFENEICLQSHSSTCAAAAAATLLHLHGIDVSEGEMIHDCLTSRDGTEPLGLYRGLMKQTESRQVTPQLVAGDLAQWKDQNAFPLVALVTFQDDVELGINSFRRILGRQGEGHAVVVFGQTAKGRFLIGDPAVGRTVWDEATFRHRFCGQAIKLAKR